METMLLSAEQRITLIQQIDRRIARLPDEALVRLEETTRKSQTIPSSPHLRRAQPAAEKGPEAQQSRSSDARITRRQTFLYGMGGMMALVAASTGTGWATNNNKLQTLRESLDTQLTPLLAACRRTAGQKAAGNQQIQDFRAGLPEIRQRIFELGDITNQMNDLLASLNEDDLLKTILVAFVKKDIPSLIAVFLTFANKVEIFCSYVSKVPEMIQACQNLLASLSQWFSREADIDVRLFQPLQQELFHSIDDVCNEVNQLNQIEV